MPDFRNFEIDLLTTAKLAIGGSVTVGASNTTIVTANANVYDIPVLRVQTEIVDSRTGESIQNFRAGNAVRFAVRVDGFTAAQHRELVEQIGEWMLYRRAGIQGR